LLLGASSDRQRKNKHILFWTKNCKTVKQAYLFKCMKISVCEINITLKINSDISYPNNESTT
jgi:hypothetical protein